METAMTAAGRRWTARDAHTTHSLLVRTHTVATASAPPTPSIVQVYAKPPWPRSLFETATTVNSSELRGVPRRSAITLNDSHEVGNILSAAGTLIPYVLRKHPDMCDKVLENTAEVNAQPLRQAPHRHAGPMSPGANYYSKHRIRRYSRAAG